MKSEPKPGTAVAEPLWVIAVALFAIAGAVGYYGYRDLQRRPEAIVAVVHVPAQAGVGTAPQKRTPSLVATNGVVAAGNAAKPTEIMAAARSPKVSGAAPVMLPSPTGIVASAVSTTNTRPAESSGPVAQIWDGRIIFDRRIRGVDYLPLQTITGVVRLRGTPPAEKPLPIDPLCSALRDRQIPTTRFYLVGADAGLADVFVYIRSGFKFTNWALSVPPLFINQQGCEYVPYVAGTQTGQSIWVRNSDLTLHNVHPTPAVAGNREYNKAQPPNTPDLRFSWQQPELFLRFKCDVHPWMFAYISVVEHPFFGVTEANGLLRMPAPPPGRYEIAAVHRKAGTSVQTIVVEPGKDLAVQFTLDVPP